MKVFRRKAQRGFSRVFLPLLLIVLPVAGTYLSMRGDRPADRALQG